jgi:hypothetical protein
VKELDANVVDLADQRDRTIPGPGIARSQTLDNTCSSHVANGPPGHGDVHVVVAKHRARKGGVHAFLANCSLILSDECFVDALDSVLER